MATHCPFIVIIYVPQDARQELCVSSLALRGRIIVVQTLKAGYNLENCPFPLGDCLPYYFHFNPHIMALCPQLTSLAPLPPLCSGDPLLFSQH